ncbi:MAG: ASPIC/UnbV [Bryobacterales bacterium]|nr:ASPIC/UnbV [Bryobacterales bacterium]
MIRFISFSLLVLASFMLAGTSRVKFQDVTEKAGLKALIVSGGEKKNFVLQVNGSGACWFDYNNDGYMDLYLVNGATLAELQGKKPVQSHRNYLFRNNRNGTFTDVTEAAHVPGSGWGFGCVAADYDNDGNSDLFITNFGTNLLYHNNGNGTFTDVTHRAGLAGGNIWHAGAAFGDYDGDGFVDLYVSGYLDFDIHNPELKTCEYRGVNVHACGPMGYRGAPDALYHNNGDGTFTDVTVKAGVVDKNLYFGFTVIFDDFDGDGKPDIFVANDSNPNYLYHNKGDGTFEEIGVQAGVALNADGKEMSSMGVAVGDYDNDGRMDLFVTTFANDNYVLFHNEGGGFFADQSYQSGIAEATIPHLGWATFFLDYDNDGHKDLFAANGHVFPEVDGKIAETYRQPLQLFRNAGRGKFREVSGEVGFSTMPWRSARGGAYCDYDNDGDIDILVSNIDDRPQLLENVGGNRQHWLELKLIGTKSNRDAIGAQVEVEAGGLVQYDHVRAGGSFISSNDPRLHFGLGERSSVDRIEIRWPSGTVERLPSVNSNQIVVIKEGFGIVVPPGDAKRP